MGEVNKREPMKLHRVFLFGFLASLTVVGGLIWLFAAYETADLLPMFHAPRLSQDTWFEIVRNAVTTAAALGVGITLFFSYRRQQTAEQTQRLGVEAQLTAAKAQKTAADALDLSNRQHALDQDRRKDAVIAELRTRYAKSAEQLGSEQLPVRLAGVYSVAALADDWADLGYVDEKQVCIDLLSACFRSRPPSGEDDAEAREEILAAVVEVVRGRVRRNTPDRKFWGRSNIVLANPGHLPSLDSVILYDGGVLDFRDAEINHGVRIRHIELNGGVLSFQSLRAGDGPLEVSDSRLFSGLLAVGYGHRKQESAASRRVVFTRVTFDGGSMDLALGGCSITFSDCVFKGGHLKFSSRAYRILFEDCLFEADVFTELKWDDSVPPKTRLPAESVVLKNCRFEEKVPRLEGALVMNEVPEGT